MSKKKEEVVPVVISVADQKVISSKVTEVHAKRFRNMDPVVEGELSEQAVNAKGEEI